MELEKNEKKRTRVLFLCTGNSCRSQMAEAFARRLKADTIEPYSAGVEIRPLDQNAVKVMAEVGIDISHQQSKHLDSLKHISFDYVITLCDHAAKNCPIFPAKTTTIHVPFDDPPRLARDAESEHEVLDCYRKVRDAIKSFIEGLPDSLTANEQSDAEDAQSPGPSKDRQTREYVRDAYSKIAQTGGSCCPASSCCGSSAPSQLAKGIGYSDDDLSILPDGVNMGLSCGNPTALALLKPGQIVLDLGSGAGLDVFIAARKVGPEGRVIGVDMTADMLNKARRSVSAFTEKTGLNNVEFRLGEIEHLPVADNSIDVVISNCVINLSPDKPQVWNEIACVLKPGGKACISDLALKKPLPEKVLKSAAALVGCIAGAVLIDETVKMAGQAGLVDIQIDEKAYGIDVMADCNDPLYSQIKDALPPDAKLSDYIISVNVTAFRIKK